jgi:hypothetical protein
MDVPIWQYWEGPKPPWISLCMESVAHHAGARLRVLGPAEWKQLRTGAEDIDLDDLYITHRVDYIRSFLLHTFGGVWVDADFVQLRPFDLIDLALRDRQFVAYFQDGFVPMSNLFAARPGSEIARKYFDLIACRLRRNGRVGHWTELAETLYGQAILEDGVHPSVAVVPHKRVQPISWSEIHTTLSRDLPLASDQIGVMLYGHTFKKLGIPLDAMTRTQLLELPGLLGRLFRTVADRVARSTTMSGIDPAI